MIVLEKEHVVIKSYRQRYEYFVKNNDCIRFLEIK